MGSKNSRQQDKGKKRESNRTSEAAMGSASTFATVLVQPLSSSKSSRRTLADVDADLEKDIKSAAARWFRPQTETERLSLAQSLISHFERRLLCIHQVQEEEDRTLLTEGDMFRWCEEARKQSARAYARSHGEQDPSSFATLRDDFDAKMNRLQRRTIAAFKGTNTKTIRVPSYIVEELVAPEPSSNAAFWRLHKKARNLNCPARLQLYVSRRDAQSQEEEDIDVMAEAVGRMLSCVHAVLSDSTHDEETLGAILDLSEDDDEADAKAMRDLAWSFREAYEDFANPGAGGSRLPVERQRYMRTEKLRNGMAAFLESMSQDMEQGKRVRREWQALSAGMMDHYQQVNPTSTINLDSTKQPAEKHDARVVVQHTKGWKLTYADGSAAMGSRAFAESVYGELRNRFPALQAAHDSVYETSNVQEGSSADKGDPTAKDDTKDEEEGKGKGKEQAERKSNVFNFTRRRKSSSEARPRQSHAEASSSASDTLLDPAQFREDMMN